MHEMRAIAIDVPAVCQSVCHAAPCANAADRIQVVLGMETFGGT